MIKHPLLIGRRNFLADCVETIVMIPRENGFPYEIHQLDIDCFFAELGYGEALEMPLSREENGLFVRVKPSFDAEEFYGGVGFASASPLPYKIEDGALVVLSVLCPESRKAGYREAESVERDDIPF